MIFILYVNVACSELKLRLLLIEHARHPFQKAVNDKHQSYPKRLGMNRILKIYIATTFLDGRKEKGDKIEAQLSMPKYYYWSFFIHSKASCHDAILFSHHCFYLFLFFLGFPLLFYKSLRESKQNSTIQTIQFIL